MNIASPLVALLLMFCPVSAQQAAPAQAVVAEEARSYAEREVASPEISTFEAGDAVGGLISLLVLVALVVLIWYLLTGGRR